MLTRISFGVGAGVVATALLFLLMQALIESDQRPYEELAMGAIVDFVPVVEDVDVKRKPRRPNPPPEPDEVPPDRPKPIVDDTETDLVTEIEPPKVERVVKAEGGRGYVDGEYLPLVKVRPRYPSRAASRGIEGYVLLRFTVTGTGAVRDPVVVESAPPGIFDRAATEAALKFKYKPRVVNGSPVEVSGVENRITFTLQDS